MRLAKRWADEYNTTFATVGECRERAERVAPLPLTLMTGCVVGRDRAELHERVRHVMERMRSDGSPEEFVRERRDAMILGTVDEVAERLAEYEAAGVQCVYLQHLAHDDVEMVRLLGEAVAPAVA